MAAGRDVDGTSAGDRAPTAVVSYPSSKPGATTPIVGMSRGPASQNGASSADPVAPVEELPATNALPPAAARMPVVSRMPSRAATVSTPALPVRTEIIGNGRRGARCLPIDGLLGLGAAEAESWVFRTDGVYGPGHGP